MTTRFGYCEDLNCDDPDEKAPLTSVRYIASTHGPARICDGCLEAWDDEQESIDSNRLEMSEQGYNTGAVIIR